MIVTGLPSASRILNSRAPICRVPDGSTDFATTSSVAPAATSTPADGSFTVSTGGCGSSTWTTTLSLAAFSEPSTTARVMAIRWPAELAGSGTAKAFETSVLVPEIVLSSSTVSSTKGRNPRSRTCTVATRTLSVARAVNFRLSVMSTTVSAAPPGRTMSATGTWSSPPGPAGPPPVNRPCSPQ